MNELDRKVLARIGLEGAELAEIIDTAGGDYDIDSLLRTGYVRIHRERIVETTPSRFAGDDYTEWYVLTKRGREAVGLDPTLLDPLNQEARRQARAQSAAETLAGRAGVEDVTPG
jgi:hypothetical protein